MIGGSAGGLERRPAPPLSGAFRPERKAPLQIGDREAELGAELGSAGGLLGSVPLAFL